MSENWREEHPTPSPTHQHQHINSTPTPQKSEKCEKVECHAEGQDQPEYNKEMKRVGRKRMTKPYKSRRKKRTSEENHRTRQQKASGRQCQP